MVKQAGLVTVCLGLMLLGLVQVGSAQAQENGTVRYWAVICGVADYRTINDLNYTDDDAYDLADALEQYAVWQGAGQIEILIDSAASKAGIREAIGRMGEKATAAGADRNVFLFFFSGHGMQVADSRSGDESDGIDEAICAWDTQFKGRTVSNVITDDEIGSWLGGLPAGDVVAIFDTCFSGGMADGTKGVSVKSVRNPNLPPQAKASRHFGGGLAPRLAARGAQAAEGAAKDIGGSSAVVLMACEEGDLSYETSDLGNGVFSYYLVEGLGDPDAGALADENADDCVSAEEEFDYADVETEAYAAQVLNVTQVPQLFDGNPAEDTLVVDPGETPEPTPDVVTITKAEYNTRKKELRVEATSSAPGGVATLSVEGYGEMTYDSRTNTYKLQLKPVADPPESVTVTSSLGGSDTANVTYK